MGHVEGASPAAALGLDGDGGRSRAYGASTATNPFGDAEVARANAGVEPANGPTASASSSSA
jgi:hypothetical protein